MTDAVSPFRLNGADLIADRAGVAWWPAERTLLVADLHLEKGSRWARRGAMLPPYDSRLTLRNLAACVDRYAPARLIAVGDSFDDPGAENRLPAEDRAALETIAARTELIWIAGNHDPAPPEDIGAMVAEEWVLGPLLFRHEAKPGPVAGEVSGHFHPKASVGVRHKRVRGKCFVTDGRRLILPAFGAYTGGLNVLDPAISGLFPKGFDVHLIGQRIVRRLPKARLTARGSEPSSSI
ncbi:MAG: ligase-associated DNA damage response endonuclease PdeM [Alphaproteobacteria bacterium]|nr:ligase-associated DNA damage response endonuclease PdeM [Alphaproteobacteria bacterium]